jgi:virulence-associated protein VagC
MLALYLLSGPHGTIAGVCRLPDGYVHEDLGWSIKRVREGFAELFRKGFANRCETTDWVWIRRFLAWNQPENPNQWKAARKIASSVPSKCSWKAAFSSVFANAERGIIEPLPNPSETVPERLPTQEQDQKQEQYQKQEQELGGGKPRAARSAATRIPDEFELTDERAEYAKARGVNPLPTFEAFLAYWRSKPKDNTKLDWNATWHSWVLKDAKDAAQHNAPKPTRFEQIQAMRGNGH